MQIFTLGSGSSGNATLVIGASGRKLLIDIGLGVRDLNNKLYTLGYKIDDIDAAIITHSHIDHIRSIHMIDQSKIYAPYDLKNFKGCNYLYPFYEYEIEGFIIFVVPTSHDTYNGLGYIIKEDDYKLVYMTDTGYVNSKLFPHLTNANCYIFESNHDEQMLLKTNRPQVLIKRILSDVGHLSNSSSAYVLCNLIGNKTETIALAHLSEDANTPELALFTFQEVAKSLNKRIDDIKLLVAKRYEITQI